MDFKAEERDNLVCRYNKYMGLPESDGIFFFFVWIMLYSCKLKYNFRIYDFMDSYCYRVLPLGSTIFLKIIYYFFLVIIRLRVRTATINHTSTPGRRTGARDVVQIPKTGLEMHLRLVH